MAAARDFWLGQVGKLRKSSRASYVHQHGDLPVGGQRRSRRREGGSQGRVAAVSQRHARRAEAASAGCRRRGGLENNGSGQAVGACEGRCLVRG